MDSIKIFLSYVSKDYFHVKRVYERLKELGLFPWMDKENILGGEDWEQSILRAVHNSDFIVVFLSENSVNKRGFFQREVKLALKQWDYKLEDDIFLIPIKLNDCSVPESIKKFQWIDSSEENWFDKFVESIKIGAEKIGKEMRYETDSIFEERKKIQANFKREFEYNIDAEYPSFNTQFINNIDEVNRLICGEVMDIIRRYFSEVSLFSFEEQEENINAEYSVTQDLYINYNVEYISRNIVSVHFIITSFATGMAHPSHSIFTINIDMNKASIISLKEIFKDGSDYLNFLSSYCIKELITQLEKDGEIYYSEEGLTLKKDQSDLLESGTAPEENNFLNFCLNQDGIIILFDEYTLGPYSWGQRRVEIPYSKLLNILNNEIIKEEFLIKNNLI